MQIVYEDNHFIAIVKPSKISTEPHFEDEVKAFIKLRDQKPSNVYLKATHRLDRPASGIVLFAKTEKGLVRMHKWMRERKVKKTYYALVEGIVTPPQGSWEDHISKGEKKAYLDPLGKEALLHYETVANKENRTLLKIDLVTGRYHQIRVQAASRGHYVVGDNLYRKGTPAQEIALFHSKMEFIHPIKGTLCIIAVHCPFI
ncbi:MAG: RluA family pseudouridine synthase [Chlamydiia bacterium]|jgi:23S rRNA pseudouridine1911/1915/1917 synthase